MDCLFCAIVAGEIPARMIYEDETAVAFLDIAPWQQSLATALATGTFTPPDGSS